jgi:hypothetical protein
MQARKFSLTDQKESFFVCFEAIHRAKANRRTAAIQSRSGARTGAARCSSIDREPNPTREYISSELGRRRHTNPKIAAGGVGLLHVGVVVGRSRLLAGDQLRIRSHRASAPLGCSASSLRAPIDWKALTDRAMQNLSARAKGRIAGEDHGRLSTRSGRRGP